MQNGVDRFFRKMQSTQIDLNNRIIRVDETVDKTIVLFKNQNFETIRNSCLLNKSFFEDSTFPADNSSICYKKNIVEQVVWKRPGELCENPCFNSGEIKIPHFSPGLLKKCKALII